MPLKVLIASRSFEFLGGVVSYVQALLEHSDRTRVSFTHVVIAKASLSSHGWRRPFEYAASLLRFGKAILCTRPDVVHLNPSLDRHSLPLPICLLLIARVLGQRVFLFFHGWDDRVASAMVQGRVDGQCLAWLLRRAQNCSVLCDRFRDQLILAGWPPERVQVLPLMVTVSEYQGASLTEELSEAGGVFRVLFLSRLAADKGGAELIKAAAWLRRMHPSAPLQFTVAGDGPERGSLETSVRHAGLGDAVHFPGYLRGEDKYAVYREADLFVFPSFHAEGFPIAVIEALAAGLPIIYTPVGALTEVLGPENGVRMELSDLSDEAVGREIWNLYLDPARRQAMAMANRELARRYDVEIVCRQTVEAYRRMVAAE